MNLNFNEDIPYGWKNFVKGRKYIVFTKSRMEFMKTVRYIFKLRYEKDVFPIFVIRMATEKDWAEVNEQLNYLNPKS